MSEVINVVSIESKLELFTKIITDKVEEEKSSQLERYQKEKDIILKEESKNNNSNDILEETRKQAEHESNKIIAREKIKGQKDILMLKKKFMDEILKEVADRLKDFTKNREYKDYLIKSIKETLKDIPGKYVIYLTEDDFNSFKGDIEKFFNNGEIQIQVKKTSKDIIGGFILENFNSEYRIDGSLAGKIESKRDMIGIKLNEKLKEEV